MQLLLQSCLTYSMFMAASGGAIILLDEAGTTNVVWTLTNAWPSKITGTDLKSADNEAAIETIEIAHEGITIDSS